MAHMDLNWANPSSDPTGDVKRMMDILVKEAYEDTGWRYPTRIVVRLTGLQITAMSEGETDRITTALAALSRLSESYSVDTVAAAMSDASSYAFTFVPTAEIEAHIKVLAPYLAEPYTPVFPEPELEPYKPGSDQIRVRTVEI